METRGPERLGQNDTKPIITRKLWLQEVAALAAGRTLTDWKIPAEPLQS